MIKVKEDANKEIIFEINEEGIKDKIHSVCNNYRKHKLFKSILPKEAELLLKEDPNFFIKTGPDLYKKAFDILNPELFKRIKEYYCLWGSACWH